MKIKLIKTIPFLVIALMSAFSCAKHVQEQEMAKDERVPENRVIYEVFVRNFSPEGTLKGVEAQIPRLKDLGVDVVWLMPIYELGDTGKWGTYSSPYAIKNYMKIDPDNGTEQDLRDLVKTIHDNGMEIWFDWVGNHTAMDNVWVKSNPEFYTKKDGDFVHPFGGAWKDVYELNRDNEAMQDSMVKAMQYWVDKFDIDGYRCDYASGPSPELWRKTSERVLKNGQRIAWLAEDSNKPSLVKNGYFDYNYCWDFQEKVLKEFANEGLPRLPELKKASELLATRGITKGEAKAPEDTIEDPYKDGSRMVYLVNHDVLQDQGGSEDIVYGKYIKPLTVLQFTLYGMPLIYNGQEIQYKSGGTVSLAEKTTIDWSKPDTTMTNLIKKLTRLKHAHPALRTGDQSGEYSNITTSADESVYAYKRSSVSDEVIVMLNFGDEEVDLAVTDGMTEGKYVDIISGNAVDVDASSRFRIPALDAGVFVKQ